MESSSGVIVFHCSRLNTFLYDPVAGSKQQVRRHTVCAMCLTPSAGDTWNANGIAGRVKTRQPWEALPEGRRSRSTRKDNPELN